MNSVPTKIAMQAVHDAGGRQPTLDFLRGIAILSVVGFHVLPVFDPSIRIITLVFALGFQGVQLFFLISAITMCYMWDRRLGESHAALKFYIRRFFRIAPPFWFAMCGYLLLHGLSASQWAPEGIGARQIISSLFFVNGFWPDTINSVVPGGWSIVDEMTFYVFFPLLIVRIKGGGAGAYLVAAFLLYIANLTVIQPVYDYLLSGYPYQESHHAFNFFQFFNQAPIFLLGIFLYYLMDRFPPRKLIVLIAVVSIAWLGLAFLLKALYSVSSSPFFWLAVGVMMIVVVVAFKLELALGPINRLGQLSYSIYLVHFAVIEGVELCFTRAGCDQHTVFGFLVGLFGVLAICWGLGVLFEKTLERTASRVGHRLVKAVPDRAIAGSTMKAW